MSTADQIRRTAAELDLRHVLTEVGCQRWWNTSISHLGGLTPNAAWAAGRQSDVEDLIEDYHNPNFT